MRKLALDPIEVPAVQAWLEDWAARGWYLNLYGRRMVEFVPGERRQGVRYRLQPVRGEGNVPDEDVRAAYQEMGWTFVCSTLSDELIGLGTEFHIWRCDDPAAPELNTDQALREEDFQDLLRRRRRDIWIILPLLALLVGVMLWAVWSRPREYLLQGYPSSTVLLACAQSLLCLRGIHRSLRLIRFTRLLRSREPVPQRAPWRGIQWRTRLFQAAYLGIVLVMIGCLFYSRDHRPFQPVSQWEEPVPYVSLAELGTPAETEAVALDFHSVWAKDIWWTIEGDYESPPRCEVDYYNLRFPSMAANLERQLLDQLNYVVDIAEHPEFQIALPEVDSAWWWQDEIQGWQHLLLRRGGQVIFLFYWGEADLLEHLDSYMEMLERFR